MQVCICRRPLILFTELSALSGPWGTPLERTGPPHNGIQSTQQQQAAASVINSGANMQQPSASQQPVQFQSIAGSGQPFVNGNPQPALQQQVQLQNITEQGQTSFIANPPPPYNEENLYLQDPTKLAYPTLPMQPYPTYNLPPPYDGNYYSTPQQVHIIPMHEAVVYIIHCISCIHVCVADFSNISPERRSNSHQLQSQ